MIREHNRQSVRPALQLRSGFRRQGKAGLRLTNAGLGPAVITRSTVVVDGRVLGEYDEHTSDLLRGSGRPRPSAVTFIPGAILAADYDEYLLFVEEFDPKIAWHAALEVLVRQDLVLEIEYTSLYGKEAWTARWPGR